MQPDTGKLKRSHKKHFINDSDKRKRKPIINDCKTCNMAKSVEPRSFATYNNNSTLQHVFLLSSKTEMLCFCETQTENFQRIFMQLFSVQQHAVRIQKSTMKLVPWQVSRSLIIADEQTEIWLVYTQNTPFNSPLKELHWDTVMMIVCYFCSWWVNCCMQKSCMNISKNNNT